MRWSAHRLACLGVVAALALLPAASVEAQAEPEAEGDAAVEGDVDEAREAFTRGREAFDAGRYEEALAHFVRCHDLTGEPDLLYNIGTVHDRLRDDAAALEAFRAYLEARPDSEDREAIESRIHALELAVARDREDGPEATPEAGSAPTDHAPASGGSPAAGIALVVAGAAIAVGGGVLLGVGLADVAAVESATDWPSVADANERAPILTGAGIAGLAVGGAGLILGAVLWATAGDEAQVAVGPGGVVVRGRF